MKWRIIQVAVQTKKLVAVQTKKLVAVASGGVIVRTPKCGVSVRIAIYRKTVRDRQILIVAL